MNETADYKNIAVQYAEDVISGKRQAGKDEIAAAERFLSDMDREDLELHTKEPNFVIGIIERLMVHKQGEDLQGRPLLGRPFILLPWQIFCVYNLIGFYYKGTPERRYKEGFIFVPRKNGKTLFVAGLAFGLALLERKSGATIYLIAGALKQSMQAFEDILFSLRQKGLMKDFKLLNNNSEHSITCSFKVDDEVEGSVRIEALAANPDAQDSLNCNIAIADEIHAFKKPAQYNRFKEAMKAYTNKLMIGITTAGDNPNSFCYQRLQYAQKVVEGQVKDDSFFAFICKADQDENGEVDYLSPVQHEKANPSYGVTIRPSDMENDALQAQNDPQQRKDFLSRSLNVYSSALKAYFDVDEFKRSNAAVQEQYGWTLADLVRLPIKWYGGADLSKLHDLTAAALMGNYKGIDIIIPHAFFPIVAAYKKAEEDGIPLFGWRDDGWLTMSNNPTVNYAEVVNWFKEMRGMGFRIDSVGHDRKFCREYFIGMKKAKFNIVDQPQYYYKKSEGFRYIEKSVKNKTLYYCGCEAYEYCVSNVKAIEKTDDMIEYEKVAPKLRIDIFDASVFAVIRYLETLGKTDQLSEWFK